MRNLETKIIKRLLNEFKMPEKELGVKPSKLSPAEVSAALDAAIGNKHVNGKSYPAWLRSIKEDSIKKINLTIEPFKKFIQTHINHVLKHEDILSIWRSFYLFTSASVTATRDPSKYDPERAVNFRDEYAHGNTSYDFVNDESHLSLVDFTPTQQDYKNASTILKYAASSKIRGYNSLYRGITLSNEVYASLEPGIQFQNWPISSWTTNRSVANNFASQDFSPYDEKMVILYIEESEYGCEVGTATNYFAEYEVVMGKRLEIVEVERFRGLSLSFNLVTCKVID
jgi:hypothetical protein